MNVEWDIPIVLESPYGTFKFNEAEDESGLIFALDASKCSVFRGVRQISDPIPQASGSIVHREYAEGYSMRLAGWIMADEATAACASDLRVGWEVLQKHLNALLGADHALTTDNANIVWTPTGYSGGNRGLYDLRLLEEATPTYEAGLTQFSFAVHSPFPYALDENGAIDAIDVTIDNPGNCVVFPNIKVYGTTGFFELTNVTTGDQFIYDESQPGAVAIGPGDWAFIGCFANNIYLNDDQVNLMAGVRIEESIFFGLYPGPNQITISSGTADLLWQPGWV